MLGLSRNIFFSGNSLKIGNWDKHGGHQLSRKTIGVIGCGNIGCDLIHLLQPFSVNILINDIVDKKLIADTYNVEIVSLNKLLKKSDFVSLHVPLTDDTYHLVNEKFLSQMKMMHI